MDPVISRHNSPGHSGLAPGGAPHHTILLDYHDGDDDYDDDYDDEVDDEVKVDENFIGNLLLATSNRD